MEPRAKKLPKARDHTQASLPPVVTGFEYHKYAQRDDRYRYIGKDEDTGEPMFLDYGRVVKKSSKGSGGAAGRATRLDASASNKNHHHHQRSQPNGSNQGPRRNPNVNLEDLQPIDGDNDFPVYRVGLFYCEN